MVEAAQTRNWRQWVKPVGISGFYGFLAGIVAAIVLWVMFGLTDLIWSFSDARWYIFAVIMAGGALIAGLRVIAGGHEADLATQLHDAHDPLGSRHRLILCLAGWRSSRLPLAVLSVLKPACWRLSLKCPCWCRS